MHPDSHTELSKIIICLWGLWRARNDWTFSQLHKDGSTMIRRSLEFLSSYESAVKGDDSSSISVGRVSVRWRAPGSTTFKLNTDVSYTTSGAGYGFVLRDHTGHPLVSGAGKLSHITSAEHGEVMAAWRSLEQIQSFWHCNIILETDCLGLVRQLDTNVPNLYPNGGVIASFCSFLQRIGCTMFLHCSRNANCVAHCLERIGLSLSSKTLWQDSSHPGVLDVLHHDWLLLS